MALSSPTALRLKKKLNSTNQLWTRKESGWKYVKTEEPIHLSQMHTADQNLRWIGARDAFHRGSGHMMCDRADADGHTVWGPMGGEIHQFSHTDGANF